MGQDGRLWRWLSALPLMAVVVAPAVASWLGLMAVGHEWLGLHGWWAVLVPLTLDALAVHFACLSMRDVLSGDSAMTNRALVWVYAVGSAWLNWVHGDQVFGVPGAVFFAAASISAIVAWDRTLRAHRRDALRAVGAIEAPLPRFRALRWVVAPSETGRAWRMAVLEGVTSPVEALALTRQVAAEATPFPRAVELGGDSETTDYSTDDFLAALETLDEAAGESSLAVELPASQPSEGRALVAGVRAGKSSGLDLEAAAELAACESKAESLRVAWRRLGVVGLPETSDVMPAVVWLAEHGVRVDRSRAYGVRREMERSQRAIQVRSERLALVGGER